MPAPQIPTALPLNDTGFIAQLFPNSGKARFFRGFIRFFIAAGLLGVCTSAWDVYADLHARHTWPITAGEIVSVTENDSKGVPGSLGKHTRYWVEYEVKFAVPASQCKTGTVSDDEHDPMPCRATVRTRSTGSPSTAYDWLSQGYLRDSRVQVFHDPNGPGVKIAGESALLIYRWDKILLISGWLAFFLAFHTVVQRRLGYLEALPEDYDASQPASPTPGSDQQIDLKLS